MISDSKRREVAAKLRGNQEDTLIPHRIGRHYGMGCHEAADRFWNMCYRIREAGNYDIAFSTTSVLADLIEPTYDRDALLGLAKELELGAQCFVGRKWLNVECERMAKHLADDYEMIARRIREALGVEDGN